MMTVDTSVNSQIDGSSVVIVVSFLADQLFQFSRMESKFKRVESFLTKHCSIYVMNPEDDLSFYHQTKFPHNCENTILECVLLSIG
jgi:alkylated DNA repair dioxygenase AlkB